MTARLTKRPSLVERERGFSWCRHPHLLQQQHGSNRPFDGNVADSNFAIFGMFVVGQIIWSLRIEIPFTWALCYITMLPITT